MQLITTPSTIASDTYTIQLHITPGFTTGTILFIFMLSDKDFTTLPGDLTEKLDTNFMFVGSCVGNCNNLFCVMPISCGLVDGNVKLLLPGVTAGVPFSVSLSVRNPGFVDSCGIQAYAVGINNAVYGIGMLPTVLSVSPITIS